MTFFSRLFVYFSLALLVGVLAAVVLLDQHYVSALKDEERMSTQGIRQLLQQKMAEYETRTPQLSASISEKLVSVATEAAEAESERPELKEPASQEPVLQQPLWLPNLSNWLAQWQDKFGYHLTLQRLSDVPLTQSQRLELQQQGAWVDARSGWVTDNVTLFYYYPQCDCVLVLEKLYHDTLAYQHYGNALVLVVFFVLALFVWLYVRANQRHVRRLSQSYQAYGRGDFSQRADTQLPHPYHGLASQFNDMAERIESLMNEHQLMVNGVSHDLKTPLARLRFALDMTRECRDVDDYRQQMQQMDASLDDLTELLDDWLLLAKLNGQAYPLTVLPHNLADIVTSVLSRLQPLYRDIHVTQTLESVNADIDISLFQRVLENLLGNGFKFARRQLSVRLCSDGSGGFALMIEEDGPGIPDEDKTRVLQPFVRLDDSRSSQGGGLGLAIVVNLLEKHGFELQVQDSELGGAAFVVRGQGQPS
ncbi:hypothetical protein CHH28_12890 [Bacterioplanes sanyensis]|uniref:histidine kinase n=1 Tax=Bacterioplanes sanyensis TaxID=1249553 RepID=A0A222FLX5_9GAMM|nr:ATP-binding protein [Bacterioplanes sanyensis]ASP39514.1 hypothetical protein CHH28_12890 [Bacterioplanes sanyensis]